MSKRTFRQIAVVNLALLLFFSSFIPAAAGQAENPFSYPDEQETALSVDPVFFNQEAEETVTFSYEGEKAGSVYLFAKESEEKIGQIADFKPEEDGSYTYEWDFSITSDEKEEKIADLEDGVYYITTVDESNEEQEAIDIAADKRAYFVHYSEQNLFELKNSSEENSVLNSNKLKGELHSKLIDAGIDTSFLEVSYELKKEGEVYKKGDIDISEDGTFLLEEKLKPGETLVSLTLLNTSKNDIAEEFKVVFEEELNSGKNKEDHEDKVEESKEAKEEDEKTAEPDKSSEQKKDSSENAEENESSESSSDGKDEKDEASEKNEESEEPTTTYDHETSENVEEFQEAYSLSVTGIADNETLNTMDELLSEEYYDGATGDHIRQLKLDLTNLGFGNFPSDPSENYGPVTMGVVGQFQEAHGLNVTGIADEATLDAIADALSTAFYDGASGDHIYQLKLNLTELGFGNFPADPSLNFGPVTMGVVEDFQREYDLDVTGIPDEATLNAIEDSLNEAFYDGAVGPHITQLKLDLTKLGFGNFPSSPSNRYAAVTMGVVENFQSTVGLSVTGIADSDTLEALAYELEHGFYDGAEGQHVVDLKLDLTTLGFGNFPESPSDRYAAVTMGVVEDFQSTFGLAVTGIADPETLAAIEYQLENGFYDGAEGEHVQDLKLNLTKLGFGNFPENPSDRYAAVTMGVVEDFQSTFGLSVTGVADPDTLDAIENQLENGFYDGARNENVIDLKLNLTALGFGNFPDSPSNSYGAVTMGVVEDFQQYYGLPQTGLARPDTLDFIESLFNLPHSDGQTGNHVVELKNNLTALGYGNFPSSPSNVYGSVTAGVVSDFQASNGLAVNGIGDGPTLAKITEMMNELNNREHDFADGSIIGYVTANSLNVRSGPGTSHNQIDSLPNNTRVEILSTFSPGSSSNSWHQIQYDGNKIGYVSAGYIQLAKKPSADSGSLAGQTIVLDAGHGGHDPGGVGGGMDEKDVVLDISLRAEELLTAAGADVIMIRRTDFFLTLDQRVFIANRSGADAYISVHANIFNGSANGTETFWNNRHAAADSQRLAHALQDATVAKMGTNYRRVDQANYRVITQTEIPSALLEVAFLDNVNDAAKLRSNAYRDRAAEAIRDGMIDYFN